jgi:hypothetical protein
MVESKSNLSGGTKRCHEKITNILESEDKLAASDMDLRSVSQQLCKMPDRSHRDCCDATMDVVFEAAMQKMQHDGDKEVLANLRKVVN